MFPIWQISPINKFASSVMVDYHASSPLRMQAIDSVVTTKKTVFTDFLVFLGVGGSSTSTSNRSSAVLYSPILGLSSGSPLLGVFSCGFSWDVMFGNITFDFILVVINTDTSTNSYSLSPAGVSYLGTGNSLFYYYFISIFFCHFIFIFFS